jgi:hypothetical protein
MAYAQLTFRESLRDIETCLRSHHPKLYHAGFRGRVSRSTLSDANQAHDWRIYADLAQTLIPRARLLYAQEPLGIDLEQTAFALDSTTIDLCLNLFPWAPFRRNKAAVKLDTLIDLRGQIPTFLRVSPGYRHEVSVLDGIPIEAGAFYVMDRGFLDFARLHVIHQQAAFFVIRSRRNLDCVRLHLRPLEKRAGVRRDEAIALRGAAASRRYPDRLRRIGVVDREAGRRMSLLTNNFRLEARTISELYRKRWQVELFFKWIKQHLRIKAFFGYTENAVKTQVWIAVCVYLLAAVLKKEMGSRLSLSEILQVLSVNLFEKTPIKQLLEPMLNSNPRRGSDKSMLLFDL